MLVQDAQTASHINRLIPHVSPYQDCFTSSYVECRTANISRRSPEQLPLPPRPSLPNQESFSANLCALTVLEHSHHREGASSRPHCNERYICRDQRVLWCQASSFSIQVNTDRLAGILIRSSRVSTCLHVMSRVRAVDSR